MIDPKEVAAVLNRPGAVVVIPTDTVYGLAARAVDPQAVARLYQLKQRQGKPGTLLAADIDSLVTLGLTRRYLVPLSRFWPGAISVIVPLSGYKLDYLSEGLASVALRIPDNDFVLGLTKLSGPLMTSSANLTGRPVAATIAEAKEYFADEVDAYYDGGDLGSRMPSTVVRVVDDAIEIVRQGSVKL